MIPSSLLLKPQSHSFSLFPPLSLSSTAITTNLSSSLRFPAKLRAFSLSPRDDDDFVIGDCVVFDENAFADEASEEDDEDLAAVGEAENLVPERWREVQAEINITKKERRKIAQEMEFGTRAEKNRQGLLPLRNVNLEAYLAFREAKLAQLNPVVLDNPSSFAAADGARSDEAPAPEAERVAARNPRWAVYGRGMNDVTDFFNSGKYNPSEQKSEGPRKLFSKDEKVMLNKRTPDLEVATSEKWVPLHSLAASGAFYLVDALLKHNANVNAADKNGWTAIHKAIIGKKQAVTNYLLRESANPFVRDKDGATLMHHAVRTASSQAIKILLLYNVDINLPDNDGWTPLHLAVQARRLDIVKLLLIKGADKTVKNKDGLTPLDMCLYLGRDTRTYELIKMLKLAPHQP